MDGLILKIDSDFLNLLEKNGFEIELIRIRNYPRNSSHTTSSFMTFDSKKSFESRFSVILDSERFLCSAGTFPVIQNLVLRSKVLPFQNKFKLFDLIDNLKITSVIEENKFKQEKFNNDISRYSLFLNTVSTTYKSNITTSIQVRVDSYVDPCYVDAGYVSPNAEDLIY